MKTKRIERQKREKERIHFFSFSLDFAARLHRNVPLRPTLSAFPLAWSWTYCLRSIRTFCLIRTARWSALLPFPLPPFFLSYNFPFSIIVCTRIFIDQILFTVRVSRSLSFSLRLFMYIYIGIFIQRYSNINFLVFPNIYIDHTIERNIWNIFTFISNNGFNGNNSSI